jgi:hypothetical protein
MRSKSTPYSMHHSHREGRKITSHSEPITVNTENHREGRKNYEPLRAHHREKGKLIHRRAHSTWCSHMADMMKNSSMQTAPKGSTPPRAMLNAGCVYHTCWVVTESAIHQYTCKVGCVRQN